MTTPTVKTGDKVEYTCTNGGKIISEVVAVKDNGKLDLNHPGSSHGISAYNVPYDVAGKRGSSWRVAPMEHDDGKTTESDAT